MLPTMKKLLRFLPLIALVAATSLPAQDTAVSNARAIADRQDAAERYNRLNAQVEDLLTANADLQRKIGALENELRKTRAELLGEISKIERKADENTGKFVTQDQLKKLVDAVNDLDKKRVEDDKKILEQVRNAVKGLSAASSSPSPAPSKTVVDAAPSGPLKGFEHVVQSGETLSSIIEAFNEALKEKGVKQRITLDSVLKANPKLNPTRMAIGTKVFLPDPTQE
jgi:dynactin complex subunit